MKPAISGTVLVNENDKCLLQVTVDAASGVHVFCTRKHCLHVDCLQRQKMRELEATIGAMLKQRKEY